MTTIEGPLWESSLGVFDPDAKRLIVVRTLCCFISPNYIHFVTWFCSARVCWDVRCRPATQVVISVLLQRRRNFGCENLPGKRSTLPTLDMRLAIYGTLFALYGLVFGRQYLNESSAASLDRRDMPSPPPFNGYAPYKVLCPSTAMVRPANKVCAHTLKTLAQS